MNEILHGIRVIKFHAWEKNFEEKVNELRYGKKYLKVQINITLASFPCES